MARLSRAYPVSGLFNAGYDPPKESAQKLLGDGGPVKLSPTQSLPKALPLKRRLLDPSGLLTWTPPKLIVDLCKAVYRLW